MDIKAGRIVQATQTTLCKDCKQEINPEAKKCHHCGKYQKLRWVFRGHFPLIISVSISIITLLYLYKQVNIASEQTNIARIQVEETRAKRIEASEVLKKVNEVRADAQSVLQSANEALKKSDSVLKKSKAEVNKVNTKVNNIYQKVSDVDQKIQRAEKSLNTFTKRQNMLSEDVDKIKTELTAEVKRLKERNEIIALEDNAISNGDTASYEELKRRLLLFKNITYKSSNDSKYVKELFDATLSSILRVKSFYISGTRVKTLEIYYLKTKDIKLMNNKIPTEHLIKYLLKHSDWQWRTKAAGLLRARKEKGVPDALLKGMGDARLDVRRASIKSFVALTGHDNPDALDYDKLIEWWNEHKEEWEQKLSKK